MPTLPKALQELEQNIQTLLQRNGELERQLGESRKSGADSLEQLQASHDALGERCQKLDGENRQQRQLRDEAVRELKAVRRKLVELRQLVEESVNEQ